MDYRNENMTDGMNNGLDYNTEREKMTLPEYGRIIMNMIDMLKEIPDRDKRSEQAKAVVKAMEILNPQVHTQENYEQKLWDHLFIISNYELDIDAPYPMPEPEQRQSRPLVIPLPKTRVKANHYGRNIESIIDLIASEPEGEEKTAMIRSLAIYMRQQYLIWNKDSVADETIFNDIEKLSDYRIKVPEGIFLTRIASDATFSRPGFNINLGGNGGGNNNKNRAGKKKNNRRRK
ncbi:MAG: DUF4290 domain-containing protein [Bacteroidales bacterium]|jgi:hypothetical protein|nr:DUF4290 domain-containing protein [Bacteroidales bacterium]